MTAQKDKLIGNCETTEKAPRTKLSIVEYWMQNAEESGLEESDFAHPNCFACGKIPIENFSEAARSTKATEGLNWSQKTPLQKAHVVPRSLGGNNEPRNFFRLCDVCHNEWTTNGPKIAVATIAAVLVKQYEQFPPPLGNRQASPNLH